MKRYLLSIGVVAAVALGATAYVVRDWEKRDGALFNHTPTPVPGGSTSGTLVGIWASQQSVTVPSAASCGNFEWEISSQSETAVTGTFMVGCAGGVSIAASASGLLNNPTNVTISVSGVASVNGIPACSFSLSGTGDIINNNTLTIPYSGTTCLGPIQGTETLRRHTETPLPPPATEQPPPAPEPAPPSGGGGFATDAIDLNQTTLLNSPRDFASWPITTAITSLDINGNGIRVQFSKKSGAGRWPDITPPGWDGPLQYTLGMALNINGRWYASTVVEYWYGLDRSGGQPSQYAMNWFYDPWRWAPMTGHQPAVGEIIGFFVCQGDCRNNLNGTLSPLRERSNVVLVPMPSDSGAVYNF